MTHVVLTGAAGRAGRVTLRHLLEQGYSVTAVDTQPVVAPEGEFSGLLIARVRADLTDLGETLEVMQGADAVVHLANIPAPGLFAPHRTFVQNVAMNHSVFTAAVMHRLSRVVWASSETTLGLPFDVPPRYAPVDEDHYPLPESSYALSKVVTETMAAEFSRQSGLPFVALRFSNILGPDDYRRFPSEAWPDPQARRWNLWGYIDERDAAEACRLALTAQVEGVRSYRIGRADAAGVSGRGAAQRTHPPPDVAEHRPCPGRAGVRASAQLAGYADRGRAGAVASVAAIPAR